jgi:hypothetical protein
MADRLGNGLRVDALGVSNTAGEGERIESESGRDDLVLHSWMSPEIVD